jgi:hypothetical protein
MALALVGANLWLLLFDPPAPYFFLAFMTASPLISWHRVKVQSRWWAAGAGLAAGIGVGVLAWVVLPSDALAVAWSLGAWVGDMAYAAVTHLPRHRSAESG